MGNQVGGPNRKPRRGGASGVFGSAYGVVVIAAESVLQQRPCDFVPEISGGTQRDTRQRPALRCRSRIPSAVDSSGRRVSTCRFAIDPFSQGDSG
jgi:hypothetical protein